MAIVGVAISRINLQHSKSSSVFLFKSMAVLYLGICLIQGPKLRGRSRKGPSGIAQFFKDPS